MLVVQRVVELGGGKEAVQSKFCLLCMTMLVTVLTS